MNWSFNGNGKCSFENIFFKSDGTYTITDGQVSIDMEIWDAPITYDFAVTETSLKLTTDGVAPNYDLTKK